MPATTVSEVKRFTRAERSLHWTIASAVLFNLTTGLILWRGWDDAFKMGHFNPISQAHVWLGGGAIVLGAIAFLLLRRDRIPHADKRMNDKQIFNLRAIQVALCVQVITGSVAHMGHKLHLSRAVHHELMMVHLTFAGILLFLILGHLAMVFIYPKNRGVVWGMVKGRIDSETAQRAFPHWPHSGE